MVYKKFYCSDSLNSAFSNLLFFSVIGFSNLNMPVLIINFSFHDPGLLVPVPINFLNIRVLSLSFSSPSLM